MGCKASGLCNLFLWAFCGDYVVIYSLILATYYSLRFVVLSEKNLYLCSWKKLLFNYDKHINSMRYYKLLLIGIISIALFACEGKQKTFSSDLLVGKWKRPSVSKKGETGYDCYRYDANGSGVTWDTAEDVKESEAQTFTWTLDKDRLTVVHKGEMGQVIPKVYTVKTLNSTTLSYEDDYGATFTFSKFTGKP